MRLAIIIPGFQADERDWCIPAFTNLARELARSIEVHVFALRYPHERRSYEVGRAWVHALGGGAFRGKRVFGLSLLSLWRDTERKIRTVHRKLPFDSILGVWATESGWLATRAAHSLGVPSVVHLAGGELAWLPQIAYGTRPRSLPAALIRSTLRHADMITVPSSPLMKALRKSGLRTDRPIREWSLGVDTEMFAPSSDQREARPFTFTCVGSLVPVKGHDLVLRSFARLCRDFAPGAVRLQLVGTGLLDEKLGSLSSALGLEGYVDFMGEVAHDELPELYHSTDCFVIGSWHEAQCMAALEAMACGLPWVAPRVGALADLPSIEADAPTGVSVTQRDPETFSKALRTLMCLSPDVRANWGRNAREIVERKYALSIQTTELLQLLRKGLK